VVQRPFTAGCHEWLGSRFKVGISLDLDVATLNPQLGLGNLNIGLGFAMNAFLADLILLDPALSGVDAIEALRKGHANAAAI
jgi:hypothetical protein